MWAAFVPLLGHGERPTDHITDLIHRSDDDAGIAGGAPIDVTWLSPPAAIRPAAACFVGSQAGSRCENYGLPVAVQID